MIVVCFKQLQVAPLLRIPTFDKHARRTLIREMMEILEICFTIVMIAFFVTLSEFDKIMSYQLLITSF